MDAFEDLVARLLRREGYWTRQNYMVNIAKTDKVAIGLPSMPRPEVDIIAYQAVTNTVVWVECKSYLDSTGVHIAAFPPTSPPTDGSSATEGGSRRRCKTWPRGATKTTSSPWRRSSSRTETVATKAPSIDGPAQGVTSPVRTARSGCRRGPR